LLIIQPELITVSGEKLPADENLPIPFIDSFAEKTQEILNNVLYVLMINNLSVAKAETIVPNLRQASLLFWDSGASSNEKIENLLSGPVVLLLVAGDHAVPEVQRIAKMYVAFIF
jgi:hypothetical protein